MEECCFPDCKFNEAIYESPEPPFEEMARGRYFYCWNHVDCSDRVNSNYRRLPGSVAPWEKHKNNER